MKSNHSTILISILVISILLGGCAYYDNNPRDNAIEDEKYGLQEYQELIVSDNSEKAQYLTTQPDGFVRFSWVPELSSPVNFAQGEEMDLYALVNPEDYNIDYNSNQIFYMEIIENNASKYYGPFETKHLDFTQ